METKKTRRMVEFLSHPLETGVLTAFEEEEKFSDEGLEVTQKTSRPFLNGCHHRHSKDMQLIACVSCGLIFCGECSKEGIYCEGCGRWVCRSDTKVSLLTGSKLCPECGLDSVIRKKLSEKGGLLRWLLDW